MLQMVRYLFAMVMCGVTMIGCDEFELQRAIIPMGDGVNKRFEQSMAMTEAGRIGSVNVCEEYLFYVCADPHIDKTYNYLDRFNDAFRNDNKASFGVVLGDCTETRDNINTYLKAVAYDADRHLYNCNLFHILGNHDLYFNGWNDFRDNLGPSVYWFEVVLPEGKDLYISLDSATGTLGRKQTEWILSFLAKYRQHYRHCVVLTHTNLFYKDNSQTGSGNMPIEESFSLIELLGKHNVSLVLQGHDHYREEVTYGNVKYVVVGSIRDEAKSPEYLKVKVSSVGVDLDWQEMR